MKTATDSEGQARKLAAKQIVMDMLGQPCPAPLSCDYRNEKAANVQFWQGHGIRTFPITGTAELAAFTFRSPSKACNNNKTTNAPMVLVVGLVGLRLPARGKT